MTAGGQEVNREARLGGIGELIAGEIGKRTGKEARACVLGHLQRGGSPTNFDRALCTLFGAKAVELIAERAYGQMVSFGWQTTTSVKIADAVGRLRTVPLDGGMVQAARALGISLGDDAAPATR